MKEQTKHWLDIAYAVVMQREEGKPWVEFKAYEIVTCDDRDHPSTYEYHVANYHSGLHITAALDEAQVYLSGRIKWDGCADLVFDEQENVSLHFCSKQDIEKLGKLFSRLYEFAAEMMVETETYLT